MIRNHRYLLLALLIAVSVFCASSSAMDRAAIPEKYKWKTDFIYPSVEVWEARIDSVRAWLTQLEAFKGTLASKTGREGAENLIAFNRLSERAAAEMSRVVWHAYYNWEVCMSDPAWGGRREQAFSLWSEFYGRLTWVEPELLTIPKDTLLAWADAYPDLKPYHKPYADMFALRAHSLSEPEERIIALASDVAGCPNDIFIKMTGVDLDFPVIFDEKGDSVQTQFAAWREGWRTYPDRPTREAYFKAVFGQYSKFGNTLAATLSAQYKMDVFFARARHFDNTLQANLAPVFVPEEVYTNLIEAARANLEPLQRYSAIRKRVLNYPEYRAWDEHVGLGSPEEKRCTWEEAAAIVSEAYKPLGKQVEADARHLLDPAGGFADPFTSEGKLSGGWSHNSLEEPARMLFNFDYEKGLTQDNIRTMAHEVGHSLNANSVQKHQPIPLRDDISLVAEVPSTVGETLLSMKLLEDERAQYKRARGSEKERARQRLIYLLDESLMNGRDAFYRSVMFAAWELEAHQMAEQGIPMTQESLTEAYERLLSEFFGSTLDKDESASIFWAAYPHFYLGYYLYSYAVGEVAAVALTSNILAEQNGDPSQRGSLDRYLNFLGAGSSKHPVELLKDAGLDITTPVPVEAYIRYYTALVDELDELTR